MKKLIKINIIYIILIIMILISLCNLKGIGQSEIQLEYFRIMSDGFFYYTYLPATFIFHDQDLNFLNNIVSIQLLNEFNCHGYIKYPCGVAMFQLPFFFIAHFITLIINRAIANGYSLIYQIFMLISAIFYYSLGITFCYQIIKKFFNKKLASLIVLAITFGTGLFHYTIYEFSMSHVYSFFSISLFTYLLIYDNKIKIKNFNKILNEIFKSFIFGVSLGLITVVRNINFLMIIFYILYGVRNRKTLKYRLYKILRPQNIIPFIIGFTLVMIPQFMYWYNRTGHIIINSYHPDYYIDTYDEIQYDDFPYLTHPQTLAQLFSLRCGLFVYYPVLLFSIAGIFKYKKYFKKFIYSIPIFGIIIIYLLSSFNCWTGGASFGLRFYVDYVVIFAMLMASFLNEIFIKDNKKLIKNVLCLFWICIVLTIIMQQLVYNGLSDDEGNIFNSPISTFEYIFDSVSEFFSILF